jgi:hypothetical protein
MTEQPVPSVRQLLADLHSYRLKTMASADLQVNIDQRALLERTADRSAFVKAGDVVEPFSLPEVHGGTVELDRLLDNGPAVLLFFRYAGCPACNISLRHYQAELYPPLAGLGWGPASGNCRCLPSWWSARTGWSSSLTWPPTGWCAPRRSRSSKPCAS